MTENDDKQGDEWQLLYDRVSRVLAAHGIENSIGEEDYFLVDDNYGWYRSQVEIHNLKMLRPEIVRELRSALSDLPAWEITVSVDIPGKERTWPPMGLTIRKHEIIDGLQRRLFPIEYQNLQYADSRPGTGYD